MLSSFIYGNSHVFSISQSIPSSCQIGISHQHWSPELCSLHWHPHISKSDHRLLEDLSGLCAGSVIRDNPESGAPWELGERVDLWTLLKDPHLVYFLSFSHSLPSIFFFKIQDWNQDAYINLCTYIDIKLHKFTEYIKSIGFWGLSIWTTVNMFHHLASKSL